MQLRHQERGKYLLISASGRLDASWAEHFAATFREHIRQGHHHLLLDASQMSYLSSAGIRALVQITKSVATVKGSFQILHADSFVQQTLTMTGFGGWLIQDYPKDMPAADAAAKEALGDAYEAHLLDGSARLSLSIRAKWLPWEAADKNRMAKIRFGWEDFALGIGAPEEKDEDQLLRMGEFLAIGGHVVCQTPREGERPDFLLAESDYLPSMHCMQALCCQGSMSHLIRFSPKGDKTYFGLGELAEQVLQKTQSTRAGFVVIAEIDGLVGSVMIQSPGTLQEKRTITFPELKEWLSFCGERVHARQQALIFGLVARPPGGALSLWLPASGKHSDIGLHAHAAVFPYQPLQSGIIHLKDTVQQFFNGPPPLALYHLLEDNRPATGLGESSLIRGACWCAAIHNEQEDTSWE